MTAMKLSKKLLAILVLSLPGAFAAQVDRETPLLEDGPIRVTAGDIYGYLLKMPENARPEALSGYPYVASMADAVFMNRSIAAKAREAGLDKDPDVQARLRQLAQLFREADHIEPEAQQPLAELLEELSRELETAVPPSTEATQLGERTAQLAQALHQRRDAGILSAARDRLEDAAIRAETDAPLATGVARRLIDLLTNLGI